MYYKTLNITTIEEEKKHLQKTEDKDLRRYRLNTFDGFVEYWGIEYFFNPEFKWDLPSICDKLPGLDSLLDHSTAFVDEDGNCFLLLQPYGGDPEAFCMDNYIAEYVSYNDDAYHHSESHCVIISGDFLTYVDKCIPEGKTWINRTPDASSEDSITTIDDVMQSLESDSSLSFFSVKIQKKIRIKNTFSKKFQHINYTKQKSGENTA